MREVKNRNIKNSIAALICFVFSLFPASCFGQYSTTSMISDSTKSAILLKSSLSYTPLKIKGLEVRRHEMPIFCKWELDIQDNTKIPVKFRLGSQEYVDYLEQKNKHF